MTLTTPLHELHQRLGAKLVPFAGWDMPLQYEGVIAEHQWCRKAAALFDVAHMAVIELWDASGGGADAVAAALETVTPAGITTLDEGRQRYGLLLNADGGVVDDFMVTNWGQHLTMVVNASRRDPDLAFLNEHLGAAGVEVREKPDIALVALQGPKAAQALAPLVTESGLVDAMVFLDNRLATINVGSGNIGSGNVGSGDVGTGDPVPVAIARSGYTGEDGFEIAVANEHAEALAEALLADESVKPAGLGARDTLRLEAGLCLYGNDLDETTSPVEADLVWSMPKRRREAGDFLGGDRVLAELADGPSRVRVGLQPQGKRPVRDGAELFSPSTSEPVGSVSSGGFGPSVDGPVAMAYVQPEFSAIGTELVADVRGKTVPCLVADLPFSPHGYVR